MKCYEILVREYSCGVFSMWLILTLWKTILSWIEMVHRPLIKSALSFAWMINKMRWFSVLLGKLYFPVFLHSFLCLKSFFKSDPQVDICSFGLIQNYNLWLIKLIFFCHKIWKEKKNKKAITITICCGCSQSVTFSWLKLPKGIEKLISINWILCA